MSDGLRHWHGVPSKLQAPPPCCVSAFDKELDRELRKAGREADDAVREERRRVVLSTVEALDAYRRSVATVVTDPAHLDLVGRVVEFCAGTVRSSGCICTPIEVSVFAEQQPRQVLTGTDPLCGVHDGQVAA